MVDCFVINIVVKHENMLEHEDDNDNLDGNSKTILRSLDKSQNLTRL